MNENRETLRQELRDGILLLTICRPEAGNAIDIETAHALSAALDRAETDENVKAVILTGEGDKFFCAGQDLRVLSAGGAGSCYVEGKGWAGITERAFPKPLIAAVNGYALGGGMEIALSCDLILAAVHARFGLPEVKRGIFAAGGGPIRLARGLPRAFAMELLLTGEPVDARHAMDAGMLCRVVPGEELLDEAMALAKRIVCNAPLSLRYTKELYYAAQGATLEEAFRENERIKPLIRNSEDAREGPRAFAEKRPPVWKGR